MKAKYILSDLITFLALYKSNHYTNLNFIHPFTAWLNASQGLENLSVAGQTTFSVTLKVLVQCV